MRRLSYEDVTSLWKGNKKILTLIKQELKAIICSRLSGYQDLNIYLDDLVSNALIILIRSYTNYNSRKSKFSTYAFNRIVSGSRKHYLSLKYPYGGMKSLASGYGKKLGEFRSSNLAFILSDYEVYTDIPDTSIGDVVTYISTLLTVQEEKEYLPQLIRLMGGKLSRNQKRNPEFVKVLNCIKERMLD